MTALRQSPNSATPMENTLRGVPPRPDGSRNACVFSEAAMENRSTPHVMIRATARSHPSVAKLPRSSCRENELRRAARIYRQVISSGINNGYLENSRKSRGIEIIKEQIFYENAVKIRRYIYYPNVKIAKRNFAVYYIRRYTH